jgi:hypothetical protein
LKINREGAIHDKNQRSAANGNVRPFFGVAEPCGISLNEEGWQGCFRECILYLLLEVVEKFAKEFSKLPGSETKELFSMAEIMVIKDFNWTNEEAMDRYNVDLMIQYALIIDQGAEFTCDFFPLPKTFP